MGRTRGQVSFFLARPSQTGAADETLAENVEPEALTPKQQNKQDLKSRAELLARIREQPDLVQLLGLQEVPTNVQILRRFNEMQDPCRVLRELDLEPDEAMELSCLVPGALRANTREDPYCKCLYQPGGRFFQGASVVMAIAFILFGIAVWLPILSKAGWREGTCNIMEYTGKSCLGEVCAFNVEARERKDGKLETFIYKGFTMPVQNDLDKLPNVVVTIPAKAFRCCNPRGSMNCCEMYNAELYLYCDNYQHLDGCPQGDWPCLFEASAAQGELSSLIAYEAPDVVPFIMLASACTLGGISLTIAGFRKRRNRHDGIKPIPQLSKILEKRGSHLAERESMMLSQVYGDGARPRASVDADAFSEALHGKPAPSGKDWLAEIQPAPSGEVQKRDADDTSGHAKQPVIGLYKPEEASGFEADTAAPREAPQTEPLALQGELPPQPPDVATVAEPHEDPPALPSEVVPDATGPRSDATSRVVTRQTIPRNVFAIGDLASFTNHPSRTASTVPVIEPLESDVYLWQELEIDRQHKGHARCGARPASAPAPAVRIAASEVRKPRRATSALRQHSRHFSYGSHPAGSYCAQLDGESMQPAPEAQSTMGPMQPKRSASSESSGMWSESTASRRPMSAISKRPDSSKWSESSLSNRPSSALTQRPASALTLRPASALNQRPSSALTQRPASAASKWSEPLQLSELQASSQARFSTLRPGSATSNRMARIAAATPP